MDLATAIEVTDLKDYRTVYLRQGWTSKVVSGMVTYIGWRREAKQDVLEIYFDGGVHRFGLKFVTGIY